MAKSQEVTTMFGGKQDQLPAHMQNDGGLGNENASGALATPQLKLLQALSPECGAGGIEGAKTGLLYENVGNALFESVYVVNLYMEHYYTVWKDQDHGGGKFGEFPTEGEALAHIPTLDGNPAHYVAQETHKHYVIMLDETGKTISPAVIYMKNTQLTPSRSWNTEISKLDGARFSSVWTLGSKIETSRNNKQYANYNFAWAGYIEDAGLYEECKKTYMALTGDQRQAA